MAAETAPATGRNAVQWQLRAGLAVAVVLMAAGLVLRLVSGQAAAPAVELSALAVAGLPLGDRLMGLGVLMLGLTPGLRVLTLLVVWIRERDWRFAAVAAVVMVALGVALAAGGG